MHHVLISVGKIFAAAIIFSMLAIPFVQNAHSSPAGGFTGPGPDIVTVEQAKTMRDDSRMSLKGRIVKHLGDEAYLFEDATGSIEVEIDNDVWRGLTVSPEQTVIISGEMDDDWNHKTIDISSVTTE